MKCNICKSKSNFIFKNLILKKYQVKYYKCLDCGFIQTEKPFWLKDLYKSKIIDLDVGLISRNISFSNLLERIIVDNFDYKGRFLDYAGGYGIFTRMMRDKGFDFYHEDKYCDNMFATFFDINDLAEENRKFELITAFEFMEHLQDPLKDLSYILSITDNFLCSTELVPKGQDVSNWWYLGLEHGQHISFYTNESFEKIADKYNKKYYSNNNIHLLSKKEFEKNPLVIDNLNVNKNNKLNSLTQHDFNLILKNINV